MLPSAEQHTGLQEVTAELTKAWGQQHSAEQEPCFSLPPCNPYIPSDFALIESSQVRHTADGPEALVSLPFCLTLPS